MMIMTTTTQQHIPRQAWSHPEIRCPSACTRFLRILSYSRGHNNPPHARPTTQWGDACSLRAGPVEYTIQIKGVCKAGGSLHATPEVVCSAVQCGVV